MDRIEAEAAWYREALRFRIVAGTDVATWAAEHLGEAGKDYDVLLELSFLGRAHPLDVFSMLRTLSTAVETVAVLPEVLGYLYDKVRSDRGYGPELGHALYQLYVEAGCEVPEELALMSWFDDAFGLATSRTWGAVEEVQAELEAFIAGFAERLPEPRFRPAVLPQSLQPSGR
ncbi:MAG: hypothetical protein ACREVL_04510, partial [Solimonas sp.]